MLVASAGAEGVERGAESRTQVKSSRVTVLAAQALCPAPLGASNLP